VGLMDFFRRGSAWSPPPDHDDYWYGAVGVESAAGVEVNEHTAATLSAFYACERVICEDVASLPLVVYERTGEQTKRRALSDHRYVLLHDQPNPYMTAMSFRETLTRQAVRWGNGYAWIERVGNTGLIKALWPLQASRMKIVRTESGLYVYRYQFDTGPKDYPPEQILHITGPGSDDGWRGCSVVALARDSIGLGLAAERFGSRLFANDARPGVVLEHPGPAAMSDIAYDRLKKSWEVRHMGADNAHKAAILEEGVKVHEVGFPPEDIQFLETREHQVREMCRWFRMQPHKIGDLKDATFSNIEQQSIEHVTDTIRPWCVRWEQAIRQRLFGPNESRKLFAEHVMEGLLRGDIKSRYEAYAIGKQWGFLSTNDIREKENLNPVDDGDQYLVPLNMIPAGDVGMPPKGGEPAPKRSLPEQRSGEARRRLAEIHRPLFEKQFKRLIVRERSDILKGAKAHLGTRDTQTFVDWARGYYDELRESGRWGNELWGLYRVLGAAVQKEAAAEVGGVMAADELDGFLRKYVAAYVDRHAGISMSDILAAIGKPDGDPLELLTVDLSAWDTRPASAASWEVNRWGNAVARETYRANGIRRIRWQTHGDNCPYCNQLNGKVVGIEEPFARKGDHLQDPANPNNWMSFSGDHYHPPGHAGCDCTCVAA
jgi:HK97 family phage portal protein